MDCAPRSCAIVQEILDHQHEDVAFLPEWLKEEDDRYANVHPLPSRPRQELLGMALTDSGQLAVAAAPTGSSEPMPQVPRPAPTDQPRELRVDGPDRYRLHAWLSLRGSGRGRRWRRC